MNETEEPGTLSWVLHPDIASNNQRRPAKNALDEATSLAKALPGLDVIGGDVIKLKRAHPGMLFGKGKVQELGAIFKSNDVALVLIDGPVSPVQQRNLEEEWGVKVLDRTGLILEIFSDRARTREGVLQVEMAALSYQRTRLVRAWTHLERQRGGLGFVGGPGETQIESDRRAIDDAIVRIRKHLSKVVKTRELHRAARAKIPFPVVALVGYTNAGKSTLFNRLTGASVFVKDMLFATLDPTMRSVEIPDGPEIIMSDTVGFISDLPTELVASFRATLEEVLSADLILHVRDISHPESEQQARDVIEILTTLGVDNDIPMLEVWNKIDLMDGDAKAAVETRAARHEDVFPTSATTGAGINVLMDAVTVTLEGKKHVVDLHLTFAQGKQRAWMFQEGVIEAEEQVDDGFKITVRWTNRQEKRYRSL